MSAALLPPTHRTAWVSRLPVPLVTILVLAPLSSETIALQLDLAATPVRRGPRGECEFRCQPVGEAKRDVVTS